MHVRIGVTFCIIMINMFNGAVIIECYSGSVAKETMIFTMDSTTQTQDINRALAIRIIEQALLGSRKEENLVHTDMREFVAQRTEHSSRQRAAYRNAAAAANAEFGDDKKSLTERAQAAHAGIADANQQARDALREQTDAKEQYAEGSPVEQAEAIAAYKFAEGDLQDAREAYNQNRNTLRRLGAENAALEQRRNAYIEGHVQDAMGEESAKSTARMEEENENFHECIENVFERLQYDGINGLPPEWLEGFSLEQLAEVDITAVSDLVYGALNQAGAEYGFAASAAQLQHMPEDALMILGTSPEQGVDVSESETPSMDTIEELRLDGEPILSGVLKKVLAQTIAGHDLKASVEMMLGTQNPQLN